jgi:hypothetical protein
MDRKPIFVGAWTHLTGKQFNQQFEIFETPAKKIPRKYNRLVKLYEEKKLSINFIGEIKDTLGMAICFGYISKEYFLFTKIYDEKAQREEGAAQDPLFYYFPGDLDTGHKIAGEYRYAVSLEPLFSGTYIIKDDLNCHAYIKKVIPTTSSVPEESNVLN